MKNISVFDACYGCGVCYAICPNKAITMSHCNDGFIKPIVDKSRCNECQLCLKVCAFNDKTLLKKCMFVRGYAAYSNNDNVRSSCSSGGISYELAIHSLKKGYKICVVRYNTENHFAEHYIASSINELKQSCGSKYIQSHSTDAFSSFKRGEKYMVVGTPCQIDSLRRYIQIKKIEPDFILVDFFCHGVPSDLMWKKYIKEYGLANSIEVKWRDKRTGWHDSWNMVFRSKDDITTSLMSKGDLFYKFFLKNRCLGKACYDDCKYKLTNSAADIRVGDLWGTKYHNDEKGVNGVMTLTSLGEEILSQLTSCTIIPECINVVTESQMKYCPKRPSSYKYVINAIKTDASLNDIDKKARRIELLRDLIPQKVVYYSHYIITKTRCMLKR